MNQLVPVYNQKTDTKIVIHIRGGHKSAYRESEPKIDLMLLRSTVNEKELCGVESFFANLKIVGI